MILFIPSWHLAKSKICNQLDCFWLQFFAWHLHIKFWATEYDANNFEKAPYFWNKRMRNTRYFGISCDLISLKNISTDKRTHTLHNEMRETEIKCASTDKDKGDERPIHICCYRTNEANKVFLFSQFICTRASRLLLLLLFSLVNNNDEKMDKTWETKINDKVKERASNNVHQP